MKGAKLNCPSTSGGAITNLSQTVEFRIYTTPTGGTAIWGHKYAVMLDDDGLFNVELRDDAGTPLSDSTETNKLPAAIATDSALYLGLTVEGSDEIQPRQQLLAVPFALMAGDVKTATGDFEVQGELTARDGVNVTGGITATESLQIGGSSQPDMMTTLESTESGGLRVSELEVDHNATVSGNLTADGDATVSGKLTVDGDTTVSDLTITGELKSPASLFSREVNSDEDDWHSLSKEETDHKIFKDGVTSDGFIIISFHYVLDTDGPGDSNQIMYEINFAGDGEAVNRTIRHGIYCDNLGADHFTKHDVVTLPILKGETVTLHQYLYDVKDDTNTEIKVRAVFVPFGN